MKSITRSLLTLTVAGLLCGATAAFAATDKPCGRERAEPEKIEKLREKLSQDDRCGSDPRRFA